MTRRFSISATGSKMRSGGRSAIRWCAACAIVLSVVTTPLKASTALRDRLDRLAKETEEFWDSISGVTCTESILQSKINAKGKVLAERDSKYDYLVFMQLAGGELSVEESRIERGVKKTKTGASFLTSNGFSVLTLIFHPHFQSSYEFESLGSDTLNGKRVERIGFRHIAGSRSPSVLVLKQREYPLEWIGSAWVVPDTNTILRIHVQLAAPMTELGLLEMKATVDYSPVSFTGVAQPLWLPTVATVEAATRRQRWRNVHRFTGYRRFNVETQIRTAGQ